MPARLSPAHAAHVTHASHASPPRRRDKRAPHGEGATGTELRSNTTEATRARALLGPGPTTLGTVYGPGPGAPVGVLKYGYPSTPNLCTGSCSTPRQGWPWERQESPWPFLTERRPSIQDKAPARGACQAKEARPRQEELAGTTEPKHRDPGKRSLPGRPFQAQDYITGDTLRRYTRPDRARGAASFRARRVPGPGKIKTPASYLLGRVALCARAP